MRNNTRPDNSIYKTESLLINFLKIILNGDISLKVYLIFAISQNCFNFFSPKIACGLKVLWWFSYPRVRRACRQAWLSVQGDSVPVALGWSLWPPSQNVFKSKEFIGLQRNQVYWIQLSKYKNCNIVIYLLPY